MKPTTICRPGRWRLLLAGALTVAVVGGAVGYAAAQSRHVPTAQVFVSDTSVVAAPDPGPVSNFAQQVTKSFARFATTPTVLKPVIEELGLRVTPAEFAQQVTTSVPSSTFIDISVEGGSQLESAQLSNALAEQLVKAASRLSPGGERGKIEFTQVDVAR